MDSDSYSVKNSVKDFLSNNKGLTSLYLFTTLMFPIIEIILPKHYGTVIDNISKLKSSSITKSTLIKKSLIIIVVLWVLLQLLLIILDKMEITLVPQLQSYIRKDVIQNILESFKNNYKDLEVGDLISKIVKLPIYIRDLAHQFVNVILPLLMVTIVTTGYLFYIDRVLGLIYLANIAIMGFILYKNLFNCIDYSEKLDLANNQLHEQIGDVLNNLINVYAADTAETEVKGLKTQQKKMDEEYKNTMNCSTKLSLYCSILNFMTFMSVVGYGFYLFTTGKIKLAYLIGIFIINIHYNSNITRLSAEIHDILFNFGNVKAVQKYFDELQIKKEGKVSRDWKEQRDPKLKSASIKLEHVTLKYDDNQRPLFKDMNLYIRNGEKVLLLGHNGSGKTTFIKMLMRLKSIESGKIYIGDHNTKKMDANKLRKQIVYVDQSPKLFDRSIYENIVYGNHISKKVVDREIKRYGLGHILGPLNRRAGKNGHNLSGGQRQIVYLLRCIFKNTPILMLDEPTSELDKDNKEIIFKLLNVLMKDKTVIMVTHDPFLLKYADRI